MTGTVADLTAYRWYAGGRWRVMSPNCSTVPAQTGAHLGVGRSGSRLAGRLSNSDSETLGHETSSRGWLSSERSRW